MLTYLQLPFHFDAPRMQEEVNALSQQAWRLHYNKKHYEGDWTVLALRSPGGSAENIYSLHAAAADLKNNRYQNTPLLEPCTYLKQVLDHFECEKTMVRLMKLNAGAVIRQHKDADMNFEAGEARFHISVQTNQEVAFFIEEERIPMQEGECWYLNLSLDHRVSNNGTTDRIHLVVDCVVNDWLLQLFSKPALRRKETPVRSGSKTYSASERGKIIEALRILNTTVANELAQRMESELQNDR